MRYTRSGTRWVSGKVSGKVSRNEGGREGRTCVSAEGAQELAGCELPLTHGVVEPCERSTGLPARVSKTGMWA
eukprot:122421-Rhodomonas_salina.1